MPVIHKLPRELVEKIAAGEVVERPASAVKELLENALDAKATLITIELEAAGTQLIKVVDNGTGMEPADLLMAVEAHATSKISSADDLFAIHTLGFRGEALASICAVAKVDVTTRQQSAVAASTIHVEGGIAGKIMQVGAAVGTSVTISDLFYNVPARRKFLKSPHTELQAILTLVSNYCLVHPHVHFTLVNDGKQLISSPASKQMLDKIGHIYGTDVARQLLPVSLLTDDVTVVGYTANPSLSRADKKSFTFFLNGRFIRNPNLLNAVVEGYETLLMVGRYPVGVINIIVDAHAVDVNVHPSKDIVKFDNESTILDAIRTAVKQTLDNTHLLREHKEKEVTGIQQTISPVTTSSPTLFPRTTVGPSTPHTVTLAQSSTTVPRDNPSQAAGQPRAGYEAAESARQRLTSYGQTIIDSTERSVRATLIEDRQQVFGSTPDVIIVDEHLTLRYLGLLHRTYAICESKDGLVMIDFHAAHERYLYEQLKAAVEAGKKDGARRTQALLAPLKIELSPSQLLIVNHNIQLLESLGFVVDDFGGSTILVRSVPLLFHKQMNKSVLLDIIDELSEGKTQTISERLDKIMIRMSCRAADKAGDELSDEKIKEIIRQVSTAGHKYSCPHGRPIFLSVSKPELEKMFKRRV